MKVFVNRLIFFLLIFAFLIIAFQALISLKIYKKTIWGIDNLEQTANINADMVFIGSSRCWAHFDPIFFDSIYKLKSVNIGVDGHSEISMAIVRLKDYLSRNQSPKFVILNFDPFMHAGSLRNNTNFVHKNNFARYAFLPNEKNLPIVDFFGFNLIEKYVPLYAIFKYQILSDIIFLKPENNNWIKYGYEIHDEKWDTISNPIGIKMKDYYFKETDVDTISKSLKLLNEICLANNSKLICIQTPVYKIIMEKYLFNETGNICRNLNIPFIDANYDSIRNNINFFYNSNHLNLKGVNKLNSIIKKDSLLNSILIKL
jgi:hypothetical protein